MSYRWILQNIQLIFVKPDSLVKYRTSCLWGPLTTTTTITQTSLSTLWQNRKTELPPKALWHSHSVWPWFCPCSGSEWRSISVLPRPSGLYWASKDSPPSWPERQSSFSDLKGGLQSSPFSQKEMSPKLPHTASNQKKGTELDPLPCFWTKVLSFWQLVSLFWSRMSTWVVATWD